MSGFWGVGSLAPFSPLDLPWSDLYWTEGPEFAALALADGATVTTWPSELGTADLATINGTSVYRGSVAAFNNKPAVQFAGAENLVGSGATLTQPWCVAALYQRTGGNTAPTIMGAQLQTAVNAGLTATGFNAGVSNSFAGVNGPALLIAHANGTSSEVFKDGTSYDTGDSGTSNVSRRQIASRSATSAISPLTGYVVLAGYLNRLMTPTEIANLHAYCQTRYGTP